MYIILHKIQIFTNIGIGQSIMIQKTVEREGRWGWDSEHDFYRYYLSSRDRRFGELAVESSMHGG